MRSRLGMPQFDALIAGAGVAGAALALQLARGGWRVALVERESAAGTAPVSRRATPREAAVELLAREGVGRLRRLGLLADGVPDWLLPAPGLLALWGDARGGRAFRKHAAETGWQVGRHGLRSALRERAVAAGAELLVGQAVADLQPVGCGWVMQLGGCNGRLLPARVAVDATGQRAALCALLGPPPRRADRQLALHWDGAAGDDGALMNLIEAVSDGWWQVIEAGSHRRLSFHAEPATIAHGRMRDPRQALARLADAPAAMQRRLLCDAMASPRIVSAASAVAARAAGSRWLAVGGAALRSDPLVASPLDIALLTAELAAATLARASVRADAFARYDALIQRLHASHLATRAALCALETRWAGSTFWAARASVGRQVTEAVAIARGQDAGLAGEAAAGGPAIWRGRGARGLARPDDAALVTSAERAAA